MKAVAWPRRCAKIKSAEKSNAEMERSCLWCPASQTAGETSLAPARVPDRGGERSQHHEPSQEELCQAKEEQGHGLGDEKCQAHTDLELENSPEPGHVPGKRGGPVPEQSTQSSQPTSLVPSSVMRDGVKVSVMSVAKLSNEKNPDDENEKVSVALLSLSRVCSETEPAVSSS